MHVYNYIPLFLISITTSAAIAVKQKRATGMPTTRANVSCDGEAGMSERVGEGRAVLGNEEICVTEEYSKLVKIRVDISLSHEGDSILMNDECGIASED